MTRRPTIAQRHLAAYQARAFDIGVLASCICCFPLERSSTNTGHDKRCPSHAMVQAKWKTRLP
jgi:hypothetical protein